MNSAKWSARRPTTIANLFSLCSAAMIRLRRLPQPVIARVQGLATAAGCQLVAACDLAVAAEPAAFATPGVKIGLLCTTPMVPPVRAIPAKPAFEVLLTGSRISPRREYELSLVDRVVPLPEIDAAVQVYVDAILASSPVTVRLSKAAFYDQRALDEPAAYDFATRVMVDNALPRGRPGGRPVLSAETSGCLDWGIERAGAGRGCRKRRSVRRLRHGDSALGVSDEWHLVLR
jgi:enoyl-CoA hydratase/carnithine racemase